MKRFIALGIILAAGTLLGTGCGEDGDDDDDSGGGTGGTSGSTGVTCRPGAGGACQNDQDCPKVESGMARNVAWSCELGCPEDADEANCAVSCIVMDTEMSNECATCYATVFDCTSEHCPGECETDPASLACAECQIDAGCREPFDTCSGLKTVPTPVP